MKPVTYDEGDALAKKIGAFCYIEISSLQNIHVDDLFRIAIARVMLKDKVVAAPKNKDCTVQ